MNIKKIEYIRNVEEMGNLFVFFEVQNKNRNFGAHNHFFCSAEAETPLDLAIFPSNSQIEYISFFVRDEILLNTEIKNKIIYTNDSILITDERFNFDDRYIDVKMEFNQYMQDRDIYVIDKTAKVDLIGYRIDDDNYILFDNDNNFSGVVFKNLTDDELKELKKSTII